MTAININKNNFQNEVMNTDKPVLLDFWAPCCAPCRMVVPIIEILRMQKAMKRFLLVRSICSPSRRQQLILILV